MSASSPNAVNSVSAGTPRPTPRINLPPDRQSRVAVWRASTQGRRRGTGVTIVPMAILSVAWATAASSTHGSAIGTAISPKALM